MCINERTESQHPEGGGYNDRLFNKRGIRSFVHFSRFKWLAKMYRKYRPSLRSVVELGCFDCRSLDYVPPPERFYGYDAGWEGGLQRAQQKYSDHNNYVLKQCLLPSEFAQEVSEATLIISLETLEHLPPDDVDKYLDTMQRICVGYVLVTVPNERGIIFALKHLLKKCFFGHAEHYSIPEFIYATLGIMHRIPRNQHKGFDWKVIKDKLKQRFTLIKVEGIPFSFLPVWLNTQIGFVCVASSPPLPTSRATSPPTSP